MAKLRARPGAGAAFAERGPAPIGRRGRTMRPAATTYRSVLYERFNSVNQQSIDTFRPRAEYIANFT